MNSLRVMDVPLIKILDTFMAQVTWRHRMVVALRYVCHILFSVGSVKKMVLLFFCVLQGLSRVRDGLLVTELDLNLCRQVKDKWCFQVMRT